MSSIARRRLGKFGFVILASQLRAQVVNLTLELCVFLLRIRTGLNRCALACTLALRGSALKLGAQLGKLGIALGDFLRQLLGRSVLLLDKLSVALRLCLLQGGRRTRALKFQRLLALALDCLHTLIQVARELGIAHLFDDIRIAGRIDLKHFAAMRAPDLVHSSSSMDANFNRLHSTAPHGQKRRRRHNGNGARTTTKGTGTFVVVCVVVRALQSKEAQDLIPAYGLVLVGIETDIVAKDRALAIAVACVGAVSPAVDMSVQHDGTTRLSIPAEHGVVAHYQAMAFGVTGSDFQIIAHVIPNLRYVGIFPVAVMVTTNERHVLTFDTLAQAHRLRQGQTIGKVSQDIETVVRRYALIGGIDDLAVHLLDRIKRPIHIVQDIRIAQVQVGGKPHHRLCPHFATRQTRAKYTDTAIRRLAKEPAERAAAAFVLLFRSVTLSFLVPPFLTVLFQIIVVEQQIPLKRIIRQIEQVIVVKHGSFPYRLASIHHIEPNAHLMPRAALGGNLLNTGLKYVLVAVIHHQGQ